MKLLRLIQNTILCLTAAAWCFPLLAQHAGNPLLEMVGKKPCGVYFETYESLCDSLFSGDSLARAELVRLFAQAAASDPTGEWELDRRRIEGHVRFYESRRGGYTPSPDYTAERFADDLLEIARIAGAKGFRTLHLRSLYDAASVCRIFAYEYERAFSLYLEATSEAEKISLKEFPWKFYLFQEIGDFYYSFREYADAGRFYRLVAEDPEAALKNNLRLYSALNGLGLCCRSEEEYEKSDSCFRRILDLAASCEADRYIWEGIAEGNIGRNHLLRGDYGPALARMKPALKKIKRANDDPYASGLAADIAEIYLVRGDLDNGKKYLDIALDYHARSRLPAMSSRLLSVLARYHALQGNRRQAAASFDSTLRAIEREQEAFGGLVLRRVEQQLRAADRKIHEQQLGAEVMRSRMYRQTAILISCTLALILSLLLLVGFYYRRTHLAYRELVRRSQQWAGVIAESPGDEEPIAEEEYPAEIEAENIAQADAVSEDAVMTEDQAAKSQPKPEAFDRTVMHAVEQAVIEEKMFKQADLTLDMLSAATGYSRYYLSGALNRCTGANFNTYVNEQRIKEAVRVMSDPENADLTVDAIAFDAGFNDRKNFYKVFKKVTGLSPTQFRRNVAV